MKILIVLAGVLATCAGAQTLSVSANPVLPGTVLSITVANTTGSVFSYSTGETLLLNGDGDRTLPRFPWTTDVLSILSPGTSIPAQLMPIPSTGPGSLGSYVLYNRVGNGSCLRLDVGAATPGFAAVHAFPMRIYSPLASATREFSGATDEWMFLNTSGTAHTFGAGDLLQLLDVTSGLSVAAVPLMGLSIPAQGRLTIPLPMMGLPGGPLIVESTWVDPAAGPVVRRQGINDFSAGGASICFPGGYTVPLGGSLEAWCAFRNLMPVPMTPPIPHSYALMVGAVPGVTSLPGGVLAPLAFSDPLVLASLTSGAFGALVNNVGQGVAAPIQSLFPVVSLLRADNILLQHPGPSLSGVRVRVAAVATAPGNNAWCASQMTELILQ